MCGNFCGVRLDVGKPIPMTICDFTTDVEFSVRCYAEDGVMIRFLGIAAAHKYRSAGGHADGNVSNKKRHEDTCKAIRSLARKFPKFLKYTGKHERQSKTMSYRFLQKGPKALTFKGMFTNRGRRPANGWRDESGAARMRKCRQLETTRKNKQKTK